MKHSIRKQFMLIFSATTVSTILLCILANSIFLEPFYINQKEKALTDAYELIDESSLDGGLKTDEFSVTLEQVAAKYNLEMLVIDADTNTLHSTVKDSKILTDRLLGYIFSNKSVDEVLYLTDNYTVQRNSDIRMHTDYIELWGILSGSELILMRSPVEGIKSSVRIANRLLVYIGIIVLVIGLIMNVYLSGRLSNPILQLVDISERMCKLDFDVKYTGGGNNEIALLGNHMNKLSKILESNISELKTANTNLINELDKKSEAEEMRKEFLSNVSHELKTPIALIQGYSEGLKDCVNTDEESRDFYCDVIIDEAGKMNKLVKNLLELNQLEFGNDNIFVERFDIVELVANCIQADDILIKQNGIKVDFWHSDDVMSVWADEFKIEQVVNNYLSNAIHYCKNEKRISVRIQRREDIVSVGIFNSGDPIPEESIPHLWTKFYKVDKARTREYGGSGIGLSIVKAIMDSHNREYGVINHENGVEFWFELDAKQVV
ncbi:MAG: HAMP domain-containing histidine kinase [Lachnospiraceae bacterium]|nr:HAMP domain-containing histidine kinase [Lachnospiraceae bacterium]